MSETPGSSRHRDRSRCSTNSTRSTAASTTQSVARHFRDRAGRSSPQGSPIHVQLPEPAPGSYVKCIGHTKDSNLFAVDYSWTVYEVLPQAALLLQPGSLSMVRGFRLNAQTNMPFLSLQAFDVPCFGHDGFMAHTMRTMLWGGLVTRVWMPEEIARTLPQSPRLTLHPWLPRSGREPLLRDIISETTATVQAATAAAEAARVAATEASAAADAAEEVAAVAAGVHKI